jgi:hypothetical protein
MNKAFAFAVLAAAFCAPSPAWSAPTGFYNPFNGAIYLQNDHSGSLANFSVFSKSGSFRDASWLNSLPGATKDDSELPFVFTYLGLPVGQSFVGYIVKPNTPVTDFYFEYRRNSLLEPLTRGDFIFPEPSSCTLAAMSALAFAGTARRARGRRRIA